MGASDAIDGLAGNRSVSNGSGAIAGLSFHRKREVIVENLLECLVKKAG